MKSIWYKHTFWYTSTLYQTRSYKNIYTLKNLDIVTWRSSIELLFLYNETSRSLKYKSRGNAIPYIQYDIYIC